MPITGNRFLQAATVAVLLLFVSVGLLIPWMFETTTLWYKIGADKIMLQSGQYAGMLGFVLLYLQPVLAVRPKQLAPVFGAATLVRLHQRNGLLVVAVATVHIVLVLAPEGLSNVPIGTRFWPEMVGMALFLLLTKTVLAAGLRRQLGFDYRRWRRWHRLLGYLAVPLVSVHALFVSESFQQPLPRGYLAGSFLGLLVWVCWVKWSGSGKNVGVVKKRS